MDSRSVLWTLNVSCRRYLSAMIFSLAAAAAMSGGGGGGGLNSSSSPLLLLDPFDVSSSSSSPSPGLPSSNWSLLDDDNALNASAAADGGMLGDPVGGGMVVAGTQTLGPDLQSATAGVTAGAVGGVVSVAMTPAVGAVVQEVSPWDVALCVTGTLVSCENVLVIAVLCYTPALLRAPMFILIGSLAAADLLAGLGLILNFALAYLVEGGPAELAALLSAGLLIAAFSASVLSVLAITVDRYLSLYNALTYHTERTVACTYAMVALVWAACLALGALPALGWNCLRDEAACSALRPVTRAQAVALASGFLAVFAAMTQFYLQICKIAFRHAQQIASQQHQFLAISTTKGVSTLTAILCAFGACWLPFALYAIVADRSYPALYTYAAALPAAACSVINPVVYAFRNPDIQKSLWLACCGCVSSNLSLRPRTSSDV